MEKSDENSENPEGLVSDIPADPPPKKKRGRPKGIKFGKAKANKLYEDTEARKKRAQEVGERMLYPHPPTRAGQTIKDISQISKTNNPFEDFLRAYYNDPVAFVRLVLKAQPLPWQVEFLEAVARGERRISVRAGHGVGKSTACSWAIIWHAVTRYPQKTVCTAPTSGQLFDALFAELKHWINRLPPFVKDLWELKADRVELKASPESSFVSARTSSADKPEALAGVHSENVMLVIDEASGVPEPVFESAAGSMSGEHAITIMISNPTRNSGLFFQSHHALKDDWFTMHVNSHDNPLVSEDFIKQIANTYGLESNAYRVRVLGEFATRDDDVLIAADLVDDAMARDLTPTPFDEIAPLVYGLDVARFGDDRSVLCKRQNNTVREFKVWKNLDLMQLVGAVVAEAKADTDANPAIELEILVDSIGLGAGVADRLRELGFNVRDVNVAESSAMNPTASRLRDELWLECRDWLRARACKLPRNDDLRQELVSPTYRFTSTGKIQVESKDSMKKRGLRSPDLADSLCLTFASTAAGVSGRAPMWVRGQPLRRNIKGIV